MPTAQMSTAPPSLGERRPGGGARGGTHVSHPGGLVPGNFLCSLIRWMTGIGSPMGHECLIPSHPHPSPDGPSRVQSDRAVHFPHRAAAGSLAFVGHRGRDRRIERMGAAPLAFYARIPGPARIWEPSWREQGRARGPFRYSTALSSSIQSLMIASFTLVEWSRSAMLM